MVIERKMVTIVEAERIYRESKTPDEAAEKLHTLSVRQPAPPPPKGGISIRKAATKYEVSRSSISRWTQRGLIKILQRTVNWLYLDEQSLQNYLSRR